MDWRERFAAYAASRLPSAESVRVAGVGSMPAGASNETVALDLEVRSAFATGPLRGVPA